MKNLLIISRTGKLLVEDKSTDQPDQLDFALKVGQIEA